MDAWDTAIQIFKYLGPTSDKKQDPQQQGQPEQTPKEIDVELIKRWTGFNPDKKMLDELISKDTDRCAVIGKLDGKDKQAAPECKQVSKLLWLKDQFSVAASIVMNSDKSGKGLPDAFPEEYFQHTIRQRMIHYITMVKSDLKEKKDASGQKADAAEQDPSKNSVSPPPPPKKEDSTTQKLKDKIVRKLIML